MSIVTGGQVSLHTMRMLKQIVVTSLRISFYIVLTVSLFFCIKKKDYLSSLDFKAIALELIIRLRYIKYLMLKKPLGLIYYTRTAK